MTYWTPQGLLRGYAQGSGWCELFGGPGGPPSAAALAVLQRLDGLDLADLQARARDAERELYNLGITFTVYVDRDQIDRVLPFDVIPRILTAAEWQHIEAGVIQRVTAINALIADIYGPQRILADGVVPRDLIVGNANYRPEMQGIAVPCGTYAHVCGIDLVRDGDGRFLVLEDNARTPSGVSYVVENRHLTHRAFPDLLQGMSVRSVSDYGQHLVAALRETAEAISDDPQVVLLSPGVFNSAYFEHIFLAREMGAPLVEGRDLVVLEDDRVYMKTIGGLQPVHVIYRRINDEFLDPDAFNPDSLLGVAGLMRSYRAGKVVLANAPGTGIADDKAVYAYMPRIIPYYTGEAPILANVPTHICREPDGLRHTLANLRNLVVKPVGESGGYGVVIGPRASDEELREIEALLRDRPDNYISQPMVNLSVCPTLTDTGPEPRHVDLRPFAVTGRTTWVLPGGLSRVALRKGSLIVNSSQGGGSKDTWVVE